MAYRFGKPVQNLVFDVKTKEWRPMPKFMVDGDGNLQMSTTEENASLVLGYTGDLVTTVTKTVGSSSYQMTLGYDGNNKLITVSEWVAI